MSDTVTLGLCAPKMKEQFPCLDDNDAYNFDQDNITLSRLKIRGVISPSEAQKARDRLAKEIGRAIARSSPAKQQTQKDAA